ncbi:MAG TPA: hemerythrin domain-containing protein [Kofleriaceae bacterium]|nr:hemerythrin domain-containing protein [Kofleriaceae bacterium]
MDRSHVLEHLLAQHASLRALMAACEQLESAADLERASARLRLAFEEHNRYEEAVLRPILGDVDSFGDVRIDRMLGDHADEHRALSERMATASPSALQALLATLREHLATEERYFLSPRVVRDSLVVVEAGA